MTSTIWATSSSSEWPDTAASQVRSLVQDERFAPRREDLQGVLQVLENTGQSTQGWEHANLLLAFPPDSTIRIPTRRLAERILGLVAAVSVFAPIAWTWYSLSKATAAYQTWIDGSAMPEAGEGTRPSFLQLWVEGFEGQLSRIHYLTNVAVVSVALIGLAVLLIALHRWIENLLDAQEASEYAAAEAQLASALTSAQRAIGHSLLTDERSTESLVRASVRELGVAHEQTRASAEELRQVTELFGTALKETETSVSELNTAARETATLTASAAQEMGTLITSTKTVLQDSLAELARTTTELRTSVQGVSRGSDAVADAAASLPQGFSAAVQSTMTSVEASVNQLIQQLTASSVGIGASTQRVSDSVDNIGQALSVNSTAVQAQISEITLAREKLQELSAVLAASLNGHRP